MLDAIVAQREMDASGNVMVEVGLEAPHATDARNGPGFLFWEGRGEEGEIASSTGGFSRLLRAVDLSNVIMVEHQRHCHVDETTQYSSEQDGEATVAADMGRPCTCRQPLRLWHWTHKRNVERSAASAWSACAVRFCADVPG